jgi:putative transposase
VLIEKHFGCVRYIYNKCLETKIKAYENNTSLSCIDLTNGLLIEEKANHEWLKEVHSQPLQMSIRNLDNAFKRFFKQRKGFPNFKKKRSVQSFQFPQGVKLIDHNHLYLPKIGNMNFVQDRQFSGKIKTSTISKTHTNKYFISLLIDNGKELPKKAKVEERTTIGIDVGIKSYIVMSNGDKIDNPKFLNKKIERLRVLQRRASKKTLGSKNRSKANLRVAILREKVRNQRNDFLHKLSSKIVSENQTICVEDLSIENMLKNHNLAQAQAIGDASWRRFVGMVGYKSEWRGKNFIKIGRYEASSKICSVCGSVNNELKLSDRERVCKSCGAVHDRDENAAINIKKFGLIVNSKKYARQELSEVLLELSSYK